MDLAEIFRGPLSTFLRIGNPKVLNMTRPHSPTLSFTLKSS